MLSPYPQVSKSITKPILNRGYPLGVLGNPLGVRGYPAGISTILWVLSALLRLFAKLSSSSSSSSLTVLLERGSAELGCVKNKIIYFIWKCWLVVSMPEFLNAIAAFLYCITPIWSWQFSFIKQLLVASFGLSLYVYSKICRMTEINGSPSWLPNGALLNYFPCNF